MFGMKKRFLIGGVLAGLLLGGVPTWAESGEGGIDGGGGGTLPVEPSTPEAILKIVQEGKLDRRLFVKGQLQKHYYSDEHDELRQKLLGGERTLWDVLEETEIEVRMDRPCFDASGREVDGSVHASNPGAICISAFRIGPKVTEERARVETQALILHELSHLLGTTEKEAREYQTEVARWFEKAQQHAGHSLIEMLEPILEELSAEFEWFRQNVDQMEMREIYNETGVLSSQVATVKLYFSEPPFSAYTAIEREYAELQYDRLEMAFFWASAQMKLNPPERHRAYESRFRGQESLTYADLNTARRHPGPKSELIRNERIFKIHNAEEFKQQIRELQAYYQEQAEYVRCLKDNLPLPKLHGPWDKAN